jgi:hypothetical protein
MSSGAKREFPWQRLYSTPGSALDALLRWRDSLPRKSRPLGYSIGRAVGDTSRRFQITLIAPPGLAIEFFEDALEDAEHIHDFSTKAYLKNCLDERLEGANECL